MKFNLLSSDMIRCTNTEQSFVTSGEMPLLEWMRCDPNGMCHLKCICQLSIDADKSRKNHNRRCMSTTVWLSILPQFIHFQLQLMQLDTLCCIFWWLQWREINIRIGMACHKPFPHCIALDEIRLILNGGLWKLHCIIIIVTLGIARVVSVGQRSIR